MSQAPSSVVQANHQVDGAATFGQVSMDPQDGMQVDVVVQQMPAGVFYFLFLYFFTSSAGKSFRLCLILKNGLFRGALKKKYFLKVLRQWLNWGGRESGPVEPSNILKYWPKFSLFYGRGGYYYMEKKLWLNFWGGGGDKGGLAIVLTFRNIFFLRVPLTNIF